MFQIIKKKLKKNCRLQPLSSQEFLFRRDKIFSPARTLEDGTRAIEMTDMSKQGVESWTLTIETRFNQFLGPLERRQTQFFFKKREQGH